MIWKWIIIDMSASPVDHFLTHISVERIYVVQILAA